MARGALPLPFGSSPRFDDVTAAAAAAPPPRSLAGIPPRMERIDAELGLAAAAGVSGSRSDAAAEGW